MAKGLFARLSGKRQSRLTEDRYVDTQKIVKRYHVGSVAKVIFPFALLMVCVPPLLTLLGIYAPVISVISPMLIALLMGISGVFCISTASLLMNWNSVIPDHVYSDMTPSQLLEFKAAVRKFRRRSDPVEVLEFKQADSPRKHTVEFRYADMVFTSSVRVRANEGLELY